MVANANKYNIDTSKIFLNGNSAGAITILNACFLTQNDFNEFMPGVETELGGIDNAGNDLTNTFKIIGMAANSGCLPGIQYIKSSNVIGSMAMYNRLLELGASSVIHIDPEGGHGPYAENFLTNNEICFFNSVVLGKKTETVFLPASNQVVLNRFFLN